MKPWYAILATIVLISQSCSSKHIVDITYGNPYYTISDNDKADFRISIDYDLKDVVKGNSSFCFKKIIPCKIEYNDGSIEKYGPHRGTSSGRSIDGNMTGNNRPKASTSV